jgi:hypothetical protein
MLSPACLCHGDAPLHGSSDAIGVRDRNAGRGPRRSSIIHDDLSAQRTGCGALTGCSRYLPAIRSARCELVHTGQSKRASLVAIRSVSITGTTVENGIRNRDLQALSRRAPSAPCGSASGTAPVWEIVPGCRRPNISPALADPAVSHTGLPCATEKRFSIRLRRSASLVGGEAVEQAVASGAPQIVLAAAAIGPA